MITLANYSRDYIGPLCLSSLSLWLSVFVLLLLTTGLSLLFVLLGLKATLTLKQYAAELSWHWIQDMCSTSIKGPTRLYCSSQSASDAHPKCQGGIESVGSRQLFASEVPGALKVQSAASCLYPVLFSLTYDKFLCYSYLSCHQFLCSPVLHLINVLLTCCVLGLNCLRGGEERSLPQYVVLGWQHRGGSRL